MKGLALIAMTLFSFQTLAVPKCSKDAQTQIDSLLEQISHEHSSIKRIDLEFEINKISYNFDDCRKQPMERDIASIQLEEVVVTE